MMMMKWEVELEEKEEKEAESEWRKSCGSAPRKPAPSTLDLDDSSHSIWWSWLFDGRPDADAATVRLLLLLAWILHWDVSDVFVCLHFCSVYMCWSGSRCRRENRPAIFLRPHVSQCRFASWGGFVCTEARAAAVPRPTKIQIAIALSGCPRHYLHAIFGVLVASYSCNRYTCFCECQFLCHTIQIHSMAWASCISCIPLCCLNIPPSLYPRPSSLQGIVGTTCDCISDKLQRSEILAVASVRHIGHNVSIFQIGDLRDHWLYLHADSLDHCHRYFLKLPSRVRISVKQDESNKKAQKQCTQQILWSHNDQRSQWSQQCPEVSVKQRDGCSLDNCPESRGLNGINSVQRYQEHKVQTFASRQLLRPLDILVCEILALFNFCVFLTRSCYNGK